MLILTRKAEQGIVIHNNIIVRVLSVDGDRVKIGIDAPRSIGVLREELCDAVRDENRAAIQGQAVPSADLPPIVVPVVKLVPGASGLPTGRGGAV
jgi:carbon storage regulator